jgi:hypothetical protein
MTDRELIQQAQLEKLEGTLWMLNQELTRKQAEIDALRKLMQQALEALDAYSWEQVQAATTALRERLAQPEQWEQLYPDIGNPFKRPATRDEKIVNPGVYEVQPETVMAEYKFQTYAAYKTDGEMKIGVVPEQEPVAWGYRDRHGNIIDVITPAEHDRTEGDYKVPLYTAPQQSDWVGLTDREFQEATDGLEDLEDCWKAIEAKLEEKNK